MEDPGASSHLVVMNVGSVEDTGQIEFFDPAGQPWELTAEGTQQSSISCTLAAGGFTEVEVSGGDSLSSGYVLVRSGTDEARLAGTLSAVRLFSVSWWCRVSPARPGKYGHFQSRG